MLSTAAAKIMDDIIKIQAVWVIAVGLILYFIRYFWFLRDKLYPRPFIQPEYTVDSVAGKRQNLYRTVKHHLQRNNPIKYITILGDYGSGKSCFIDYLYYQLRKQRLVSWYQKVKRIQLITQRLDEELKLISVEERSHTILLLDGFDEDFKAIGNIKNRYREIITATQDFGKVVLTSRLNFWGDLDPAEIKLFIENYRKKRIDLYLAPFSAKQVNKYLWRKFWDVPLVAWKLQRRIHQNPCFKDISYRPLLLSYMNYDLLEVIEQQSSGLVNDSPTEHLDHGLKNIKRQVFEKIIAEIYERKDYKFFKSRAEFDRIMALIAYDQIVRLKNIPCDGFETYFRELQNAYHLSDCFDGDQEYLAQEYVKTIEAESANVKNRMLLVRQEREIKFSHRSFAEFYAALCIEWYFLSEGKTDFRIPNQEVADFICFEKDNLRFIPGGKFMMGEPGNQREVAVESFFIGIAPVTNLEYERFDPDHRKKRDQFSSADDEPVIYVSWEDVNRYCRWLSEKTGKSYRLPTEAEWEYACRAGCGGLYSLDLYGREVTERNLKDYAVFGSKKTRSVKQREPNYFGLYDMHGNVWEWCEDYYDNEKKLRVLRGGSWVSHPEYLRASRRNCIYPVNNWVIDLGFRVLISVARTP